MDTGCQNMQASMAMQKRFYEAVFGDDQIAIVNAISITSGILRMVMCHGCRKCGEKHLALEHKPDNITSCEIAVYISEWCRENKRDIHIFMLYFTRIAVHLYAHKYFHHIYDENMSGMYKKTTFDFLNKFGDTIELMHKIVCEQNGDQKVDLENEEGLELVRRIGVGIRFLVKISTPKKEKVLA